MNRNKTKSSPAKRRRLPLPVYPAYLLVCTLLLTSVSFSYYFTTSNGEDTARVAKGAVTVGYTADPIVNIKRPPKGDQTSGLFFFTVSNESSEVSIRYSITLELEKQLPEGVSILLGKSGESSPLAYLDAFTSTRIVIPDAGVLTANSPTEDQFLLYVLCDYKPLTMPFDSAVDIDIQAEQIN